MAKRDSAVTGEIVCEGGAKFEVFTLPTSQEALLNILNDCFLEWEHIRIGPLVPGALWEIRPPRRPKITVYNGYATVDFQEWHFHLCIGEHKGGSPETAALRKTGRAELYRRLDQAGQPFRWGLRLLNGAGDQQVTFMLPSPFMTDDLEIVKTPDWDRLALWRLLCRKYLGIQPSPVGPSASEVHYGQ